MLDQIKAKIDRKLYEMSFVDVADMDNPVTITTSSTDSIKNAHDIALKSGVYDYDTQTIEGKDTEGRNIHLPAKCIIDIN
jgi:hypothetical protein